MQSVTDCLIFPKYFGTHSGSTGSLLQQATAQADPSGIETRPDARGPVHSLVDTRPKPRLPRSRATEMMSGLYLSAIEMNTWWSRRVEASTTGSEHVGCTGQMLQRLLWTCI